MPDPIATDSSGAAHVQRTQRAATMAFIEKGIVALLFLSASMATLATLAIFVTMLHGGWQFFQEVSLREFVLGTTWSPDYTGDYGTVPLLKGTLQIAFGACAFGVPIGIGSALYLSEFAPARVRSLVKPAIEVLSGIPSIIFGLVAIFVVAPWIQDTFDTPHIFSALAATLALSIMVVPIVCTIAEDAIRAVPRELRDGALALGATPWETAWAVTLPAARSGLTAAVLLGFSRAVGETMVVTLAAGLVPTLTLSYLQPAQTFTAFIANRAGGDVPAGSIGFQAIFALGLYLFVITLALNIAAQTVLARHRRRFA